MRLIICSLTLALSAAVLGGCGWKMAETRFRLQGQVLEARTKDPVEGVFIDVSDDRDELDFTIKTDTVTDEKGRFDKIYSYFYEKWMWIGIPVFWLPTAPEVIYVEAYKPGYRRRIAEVDCRAFSPCTETCPPNRIETILLHKGERR